MSRKMLIDGELSDSAQYDFDLFVIGAGSGGVRASRTSAGFGAKVAICELPFHPISSEVIGGVGGTCVIRGCVPKKILVYGASFRGEFEDAKNYGWELNEPVDFNWKKLLHNKTQEITRLNGIYKRLLSNAGVTLFEGEGKVVDPHGVELTHPDGTKHRYSAKHILIATGSRAQCPPIPGQELAITSDEALSLDELPKRAVIFGGGYIALEFASIWCGMGAKTSTKLHKPVLNLWGVVMDSYDENASVTRQKGKYTAMFVCWILGNGCLFSWNSMLTIGDYYGVIFPKYHPTRVLTLCYQPFALGIIAILAYREAKINTRRRNLFGYTLFFISSLAVLILDLATSGKGGIGPFICVCAISGSFGVADAHVQGGMIGDLSFMSSELIQSFLAGLAASGALTSALRLITKAAFENTKDGLRKGAILFFAISAFFELLCVFLYAYVFPKLPIVNYYRSKAASEGSATVTADLAAGGIQVQLNSRVEEDPKQQERLSNKQLLSQNIDYAAAMIMIYLLTLSIFPGFLSEDTGKHNLGSWYALVLIAMYNVWDLIGRYIPLIESLRMLSRSGILLATFARLLLIPAFYFTTKYGDQGWMIMLTSFLGLSNGYLTVCVLTAAPRGYKGPEQNALGNLLVLCLLLGIFGGVTADWLWLIGKGW